MTIGCRKFLLTMLLLLGVGLKPCLAPDYIMALEYKRLLNIYQPNTSLGVIYISKVDMDLTLFDKHGNVVARYPMACGQNYGNKQSAGDFRTPQGVFTLVGVQAADDWGHDFHDGKGYIEHAYGPWFMRLRTGFDGIGIHGTHDPASIGTRATEGCIRLNNENLKKLRPLVHKGMTVIIGPESEGNIKVDMNEVLPVDYSVDTLDVEEYVFLDELDPTSEGWKQMANAKRLKAADPVLHLAYGPQWEEWHLRDSLTTMGEEAERLEQHEADSIAFIEQLNERYAAYDAFLEADYAALDTLGYDTDINELLAGVEILEQEAVVADRTTHKATVVKVTDNRMTSADVRMPEAKVTTEALVTEVKETADIQTAEVKEIADIQTAEVRADAAIETAEVKAVAGKEAEKADAAVDEGSAIIASDKASEAAEARARATAKAAQANAAREAKVNARKVATAKTIERTEVKVEAVATEAAAMAKEVVATSKESTAAAKDSVKVASTPIIVYSDTTVVSEQRIAPDTIIRIIRVRH